MRKFLDENNFKNIDFIYNNSYEFENKIIAGTRGWGLAEQDAENKKIRERELLRLEHSIKSGIEKYGEDKDIIVCMHYPPLSKEYMETDFTNVLKNYNVKKCIYGHLHGEAKEEAVTGNIEGIEYIMASCDYTNFKLVKI